MVRKEVHSLFSALEERESFRMAVGCTRVGGSFRHWVIEKDQQNRIWGQVLPYYPTRKRTRREAHERIVQFREGRRDLRMKERSVGQTVCAEKQFEDV